jgi:hypothetical protein
MVTRAMMVTAPDDSVVTGTHPTFRAEVFALLSQKVLLTFVGFATMRFRSWLFFTFIASYM